MQDDLDAETAARIAALDEEARARGDFETNYYATWFYQNRGLLALMAAQFNADGTIKGYADLKISVNNIDSRVTSNKDASDKAIKNLNTLYSNLDGEVDDVTTTANESATWISQNKNKWSAVAASFGSDGSIKSSGRIALFVNDKFSTFQVDADKINFNLTWGWTVKKGDNTIFHLDSDGNLTIAGTITAVNSGNIVMTNDVNFYINGGKFARFGSTISDFEAMLYVRNDGGQCISAQSFNGGVGIFALGNTGSKAIQSVGPSEFLLREGETFRISSYSTSSNFVNTYFAPYSSLRTKSFTLPASPKEGTMFFCKGKSADLTVTTVNHPILHGDSSAVLVAKNSSYNFGRNAIFLFFMGDYWGMIYSA